MGVFECATGSPAPCQATARWGARRTPCKAGREEVQSSKPPGQSTPALQSARAQRQRGRHFRKGEHQPGWTGSRTRPPDGYPNGERVPEPGHGPEPSPFTHREDWYQRQARAPRDPHHHHHRRQGTAPLQPQGHSCIPYPDAGRADPSSGSPPSSPSALWGKILCIHK